MLNKVDLKKEVGSLDMLIIALSNELDRDPLPDARDDASARLLVEMQEALDHLRQARGLRKMWLVALEGHGAVEKGNHRCSYGSGASAAH